MNSGTFECRQMPNFRGNEDLCKLGKEYLNDLLCKFSPFRLQHSKTFDIWHAFLRVTISELSALKQVQFFLAHPVDDQFRWSIDRLRWQALSQSDFCCWFLSSPPVQLIAWKLLHFYLDFYFLVCKPLITLYRYLVIDWLDWLIYWLTWLIVQTLCLGALALRVECPEGGRLDEASVDYYIAASLLRGPATRAKLYNSLLREYEHVAETVSRDDAKILFIQVWFVSCPIWSICRFVNHPLIVKHILNFDGLHLFKCSMSEISRSSYTERKCWILQHFCFC